MAASLPSIKRPVLAVALLYAAGVALADRFPLSVPLSLGFSFGLALCCLLPSRFQPVFLALLIVLVGATNFNLHTAVISPYDLRLLAGNRIEEAALRGTIRQTPSRKIHERGGDVSW